MHRLWRGFLLGLTLITTALACSEERLVADLPRLEVEVFPEGYEYGAIDDVNLTIDLGQVPIYASREAAYRLTNTSHARLTIQAIDIIESVGSNWHPAKILLRDLGADDEATNPWLDAGTIPLTIAPSRDGKLVVKYEPNVEGAHKLVLSIKSDDPDRPNVTLTIRAEAFFTGDPDLQVAYPGYVGPTAPCVQEPSGDCLVRPTQPLNFGNIVLGAQGTARITLRNTAECPANPSVPVCDTCALQINADPNHQNIGLGFKAGTNDQNLFSFNGSTRLPVVIQQKNLDSQCNAAGELVLLVNFASPQQEGEYHTTIVIESNDPDAKTIEIPVVATALNAPVAIAKFRALDPQNPSAPWSNPDDLEPLTRIYFDGRESYDPRNRADRTLISEYRWEVSQYPAGANPGDFQIQQSNGLYSFWAPLAGNYVVSLKVRNTEGIWSGETEQSKVAFSVVPGSRMHVQLTWDDTTNDQDLHMTFASRDDRVCVTPADTYYLNKQPQWFSDVRVGTGPNPRLDIDDTHGQGPENINIDAPRPGKYRIYVHYYRGAAPTRLTIRVWLNGLPVAEYRRTVRSSDDVWTVADIEWAENNTGRVVPVQSNRAGEIGNVSRIRACSALNGGGGFNG